MKKKRFRLDTLCWILIVLTLLTACGRSGNPTTSAGSGSVTQGVTVTSEPHSVVRTDEAVTQPTDGQVSVGIDNSPEYVASYLKEHGTLPDYFITKKEAEAAGWIPSKGNLWEVLPGYVIGGDRFGNREGKLPQGKYRECDVNYSGGRRGAERIVFSDDGVIYYTKDHYNTFERLD